MHFNILYLTAIASLAMAVAIPDANTPEIDARQGCTFQLCADKLWRVSSKVQRWNHSIKAS